MVLDSVSRCLHVLSSLKARTYIEPTPKMRVSPIFCFVGIWRPQMVGIGMRINMISDAIPITAVVMYMAPLLEHVAVANSDGSQLAAMGLHAKIRLKNMPEYAPAQMKAVVQTAV